MINPIQIAADTAWMLICTVLVLLMTIPGLMLFYSGMVRLKNGLSVVAHILLASAVVTLAWIALGYSVAFTPGNGWFGGLGRVMGEGLLGASAGAHPAAPGLPESAFFLFHLAFAVIACCVVLGATAERMRLGATLFFALFWTVLVYAPVAHWVWNPQGWLALRGHVDFAGGTVVHIAAGAAGLVAAAMVGPRKGFGTEPMVPHNVLLTALGGGLMWAGWFGFNAGSAYEAGPRAVGAVLVTQVAAGAGAFVWCLCERARKGQFGVLGLMTGAIAGLIAVTPASGHIGPWSAVAIGAAGAATCFVFVTHFKRWTGIDDALDVFALHGVGGLVGTLLVVALADPAVSDARPQWGVNLLGAVAVMAYSAVATAVILWVVNMLVGLRVSGVEERVGLDLAQHGETLQTAE